MAAPPTELLAAMREGTAQRHMFFKLEHSEGDIFVWDGIGEFDFGGDTYSGVGGFATLEGVSQSDDIQNHEIVATLNGVGLPTLSETSLDVRDEPVNIWAVWIDETGATVGSLLVFSGLGNTLLVEPTGDEIRLKLKARGAMADWRASPRAYYTDAEQQRRFPGDTGFSFIRYLENANVSGWSVNEESGGGIPTRYLTSTGAAGCVYFQDSITRALIGCEALGATVRWTSAGVKTASSVNVLEDGTAAAIGADTASPWQMKAGGVACYVDTSGDVRTPGGNLVYPTGYSAASNRGRVHGAIASDGAASGNYPRAVSGSALERLYSDAGPVSASNIDQRSLIYCNRYGPTVWAGSTIPHPFDYFEYAASGTLVYYVEDVTGATVDVLTSGSFRMRVGGADCYMSDTGVVLSPAGRRIVRSGGDPTTDFLRVWT